MNHTCGHIWLHCDIFYNTVQRKFQFIVFIKKNTAWIVNTEYENSLSQSPLSVNIKKCNFPQLSPVNLFLVFFFCSCFVSQVCISPTHLSPLPKNPGIATACHTHKCLSWTASCFVKYS